MLTTIIVLEYLKWREYLWCISQKSEIK